MDSKTRLYLTAGFVGVTALILYHRETVRKERQRAVSEHRRATTPYTRAA
ncbi:MAG: hypothetical protein KAJ42_06395 [Gemmatimonadetes bacterium]|nr:hypothetical protein [Gemmatimonadota bacterium]